MIATILSAIVGGWGGRRTRRLQTYYCGHSGRQIHVIIVFVTIYVQYYGGVLSHNKFICLQNFLYKRLSSEKQY